jgi:hypothetical protein
MISFRPGIKLNDRLSAVIQQLAPFAGDVILTITSGIRDPEDQLSSIGKYAVARGVKFAEYEVGNLYDKVSLPDIGGEVYRWQQTWSRLLHLGVIINPPLAAHCLEDYHHPTKGHVPRGTLIQGSPHFRGTAFDISGANNLEEVIGVVTTAKAGGAEIKDFLVERENNCVHIDVMPEEIKETA